MGKAINTDDFASAVQTILNGTKNYVDSLPTATENNNGLMSADQITKLKQKVYYFNTVSDMLSCTYLINGDMCITKGFHTINDGGGAEYAIMTGEVVDGYFILKTAVNNLQAKIIIESRKCNVRQIGAKGDGKSDDTAAIQAALNTWYVQVIYLPRGTYCVTGLTLTSSVRIIEGDGYWITTIKCIAEKDCDILYLDNHGAYMGTVRQLRIQGNASYKQNGLNVKPSDAGTSSFTVDYVNIENCKGVGLYIQTYSGRAAYHCNFTNLILQSNGIGADVTLNDGTLANFYCYQSETTGMRLSIFNCRISNGKVAQNSHSTPGASTTYPALSISGNGGVFNNIDIQENCGIGLLTEDNSRNMCFNNVILDMNGVDIVPATPDTTSSKPWAYLAGFFHYGHFLIKNYVTTNPATSIIQSYYSGKIEVSYMDSTTNQAHLLPYAKEVALLPCKDQDFNINVTSGYTPTYSILYGTKKGLSLPADKYLTISPSNFTTGDSFHLMVTFQINYSESSLTTYQDILKLGNFYSVYANSGNIKINGAGNVSFSSGDILRFACSGVTQKGNTENIYNMIYKYNTATGTFEQITSININNASYLTQSDFTLTLGTKLRTENPSLSIKYCDIAFGHGLVSEQMTKFILSPVLHDQCNYYMPLNGDLTCGGIPVVNN